MSQGCLDTPIVLATDENTQAARALAVDATSVYWAGNGIVACTIGGCGGSPQQLAAGNGWSVAADGEHVLWTDGVSANVCLPTNCASTTTELGRAPASGNLASDGTAGFWVDGQGTLLSCAVNGCTGVPTVVGTGVMLIGDWPISGAFTVDASYLYWVTFDTNDALTQIVRGAKDGNGSPSVVATLEGNAKVSALASDGANLYWIQSTPSENGGRIGAILRGRSDGSAPSVTLYTSEDAPTFPNQQSLSTQRASTSRPGATP